MSWAAGAGLGGGGVGGVCAKRSRRLAAIRGIAPGTAGPGAWQEVVHSAGRLLYATPAAIVLRWGLRCEAYRDFLDKLRESKEAAPEWENACFALLYSFHSIGLY